MTCSSCGALRVVTLEMQGVWWLCLRCWLPDEHGPIRRAATARTKAKDEARTRTGTLPGLGGESSKGGR